LSHSKNLLATGRIGGSHGVRGELKIRSFSGETDHFTRLEWVTLRKGGAAYEYAVEGVRLQGDKVLLKLEGIDNPETARRFSGYEIWVPRHMAAPRGEDEYYIGDLVGLKLIHNGREAATVQSVWENGTTAMLEVLTTENKSVMVPFHDHYVGEVRLAAGEIELLTLWILE